MIQGGRQAVDRKLRTYRADDNLAGDNSVDDGYVCDGCADVTWLDGNTAPMDVMSAGAGHARMNHPM